MTSRLRTLTWRVVEKHYEIERGGRQCPSKRDSISRENGVGRTYKRDPGAMLSDNLLLREVPHPRQQLRDRELFPILADEPRLSLPVRSKRHQCQTFRPSRDSRPGGDSLELTPSRGKELPPPARELQPVLEHPPDPPNHSSPGTDVACRGQLGRSALVVPLIAVVHRLGLVCELDAEEAVGVLWMRSDDVVRGL